MESRITYFENPGPENTEETFRIANRRAKELGIRTIIIASTIGASAIRAVEVFKGLKVIVISHSTGIREPNIQEFNDENRRLVESKGGIILTTTHTFSGISRAMRKKFDTVATEDIIANTLRIFGHGMKVACEIVMMATDCGLVRTDEEIIAIAGRKNGADTAVVLKAVNSHDFFDLKIREILCKPHFRN